MRKYAIITLAAASCLVLSCRKELVEQEINPSEGTSYSFSMLVGEPKTRVTYHDNINNGLADSESQYNPHADGTNTFTMDWREGDEIVAIRWKAPYNESVTLKAHIPDNREAHIILFETEKASFSNLVEGERFVLVHGDFVLDPEKRAGDEEYEMPDNELLPKIDFPTSEVSKDGFGNLIHHGGVVDGSKITFRNQDGTLENLRNHEYMVADAFVHFEKDTDGNLKKDQNGNVQVYLADEEGNQVVMHSAHTLIRLTLFLPDEDFAGHDSKLLAVSLKEEDVKPIFHRYFRMHPNVPKENNPRMNYWRTSYNNNADKENNPYLRINIFDEQANTPGVDHTLSNIIGDQNFNPKRPVSVPATLNENKGHYFTLYISVPSRHMGVGDYGNTPSNFVITAFTETHAYRTNKTYTLPDGAMQPGMIVPLNVSFVGATKSKAITDPELGITFSPGFVYANKKDDQWEYSIYQNQGQYAGMSHQTLDFGEYFTFGSIDPTEASHYENKAYYKPTMHIADFQDVASKVDDIYSIMTKQEADRVLARLTSEASNKGVFLGYYYYDDGNGNTKHKAPGSHNPTILAAAAAGSKSEEELKAMSASVGIYVGCSSQPKFEDQDDFVFLPNSKQMHNDSSGSNQVKVWTVPEVVAYVIPNDYTDLDATGDQTKLESQFSTIFKFSTWTRTSTDNENAYRLQVWTNNTGSALNTGSTNVSTYTANFARPVRPVIY